MRDDAMRRLTAADPIRDRPTPEPAAALVDRWIAAGAVDGPQPPVAPSALRTAWSERLIAWTLSALLIAAVGTASAAAALTALTGSPLPGSADAYTVSPAPGTTRVGETRAEDPDGGPPWAVRLGAAEAGLVCLGIGQVQDGQLCLVGLDAVFRPVPPAGADDCGAPPTGTRSTVGTRTFLGEPRSRSVTVVYGLRAPEGSSVAVRYADGAFRALPVAPDGSFIVARRGNLTPQSPQIEIGLPGGKLDVVRLSPSSARPHPAPPERPLDPSEAPR